MKSNIKKAAATNKTTIGKIIAAHNALEKHAEEKLPIRLSLKLFKFRKAVEPSEEFYRIKLAAVIKEYGQKNDDGTVKYDEKGNALIDTARISDCRTAIAEIENCEVEKPEITFEVDELESLKFTVNDIACLEDYIAKEE